MAGGIFKTENEKLLPGAYVNVVSSKQQLIGSSDTDNGIVFMNLQGLDWGPRGVVIVDGKTNFLAVFGAEITSQALKPVFYALQKAAKLKVFNVNSDIKAAGTSAVLPWDFKAVYGGTKGNSITVTVEPDFNQVGKFVVATIFQNIVVDTQSVVTASDFKGNLYVTGTDNSDDNGVAKLAVLETAVSVKLQGGVSASSIEVIDEFVEAALAEEFDVIYSSNAIVAAEIAQELRDKEGRKVQAVVPTLANFSPDTEAVVAIRNGVILKDGTVLSNDIAAAYVAGLIASAEVNTSLTYSEFPNAVDVKPRLTRSEQEAAYRSGEMIFISSRGTVKIMSDINTLTTFTEKKSVDFSKNRILRVLDEIADNTRVTWEDNFIGKVTNNAEGRDLFKANRVEHLTDLQASGAIAEFTPDDITIKEGDNKDTIVVEVAIKPTDAMEKLYMTVNVG